MDKHQLTHWLSITILVLSVPVLILIRAFVRLKGARQTSDFAQELGLVELEPRGPQVRPLFEREGLRNQEDGNPIVSAIGGWYGDREVILAEIARRSAGSGPVQGRRVASLLRRLGAGRAARGSPQRPAGSRMGNELVILFVEPLPVLPEFRFGPRSFAGLGRRTDHRPGQWNATEGGWSEGPSSDLVLTPEGARLSLPEAFLERAAQVLTGRPQPWVIEGIGRRLALRIANWRAPSSARTYRAILDDALSLRDSLAASVPSEEISAHPRSIRSALKRIRKESKASDGLSSSEGIEA